MKVTQIKPFIILGLTLLSSIGNSAYGASFTRIQIKKVLSESIRTLEKAIRPIVGNETFGCAGKLIAFSFTRKPNEPSLNLIKQFNIAKGGLFPEEKETIVLAQKVTPSKLADFLFAAVESIDEQDQLEEARAIVLNAFKELKKDSTLQIFWGRHANEDGSWQVITVFDEENNQILLIKIGFIGT